MDKPLGILFDMQDTLVGGLKYDPLAGTTRLLELAQDHGKITPEDIQEVARRLDEELRSLREASPFEHTIPQFHRLLYERLGVTFQAPPERLEQEFWQAAVRYTPEPGVSETLQWLHGHGLRLGVVSNSAFSGTVLRAELQRHDLLEPFAFVLSSADYGLRKPHGLLFDVALAKLALAPSEVWFVGDSLTCDMAGAKQAGLWAIWYNRQQGHAEQIRPDAEITSWSELVPLVQRRTESGT